MEGKELDKIVEDLSFQSGSEADDNADTKTKGKKRSKRSKEFRENIITDTETAKARGHNGGVKSGEVRRENAQRRKDAREAVLYLLNLSAKGTLKKNLKELGYEDEECTNMAAMHTRIFTSAIQNANLDAYFALLKVAGFDPEEVRKERESLAADRRRDLELEAKVNALNKNGENASVALNFSDEDDNNDVVIYMPQIASEEDCQEEAEQTAEASEDGESSPDGEE